MHSSLPTARTPGRCTSERRPRVGSVPAELLTAWWNPVMEIDKLLRRQAQLQAEAATVRQDLGLDQRLSTLVRSFRSAVPHWG